ncbi:hypothetical protein MY04_4518 [Flammeovirga sp. MY04]|uniref:hypothetical protein n=1 Tax=Flammeovirga sp. MY04 TaxID=1191459 RepID=UPI000825D3ED|nr:hypothetical protein [Flammeovirga sp. MY04]ANQ51853.2 hypothetical protein MY04_4518 [Flammeovirga sp. MY04]
MKFNKYLLLVDLIIILIISYFNHQSNFESLWAIPLILSVHILYDLNTKEFKSELESSKIFPFHAFYLGQDQSVSIITLFFVILISFDKIHFLMPIAITLIIVLTYLAIKNKWNYFHVEITSDRLIIRNSLNSKTTLLFDDVEKITLLNKNQFKIKERDKNKEKYIKVNKIEKAYQKAFIEEMIILQKNIPSIST